MRTVCKCLRPERPSIQTSSRASTVSSACRKVPGWPIPASTITREESRVSTSWVFLPSSPETAPRRFSAVMSRFESAPGRPFGSADCPIQRKFGVLRGDDAQIMSHSDRINFRLARRNLFDSRLSQLDSDLRAPLGRLSLSAKRSRESVDRTAILRNFISRKKTAHDQFLRANLLVRNGDLRVSRVQ